MKKVNNNTINKQELLDAIQDYLTNEFSTSLRGSTVLMDIITLINTISITQGE